MSITFNPKGRFTKTRECECMVAFNLRNEIIDGHDGCPGYIPIGEEIPELNLANGNAANLLQLLQIEFDYCGSVGASDLLVRVAIARTAQIAEFTRTGTQSGNVFNCALTDTQVIGYLNRLAEVANWAMAEGIDVQWA